MILEGWVIRLRIMRETWYTMVIAIPWLYGIRNCVGISAPSPTMHHQGWLDPRNFDSPERLTVPVPNNTGQSKQRACTHKDPYKVTPMFGNFWLGQP